MPTYKYPTDIEARTYLDVIAFEYTNPSVTERQTSTLQENPIEAVRGNQVFNAKLYIPGGFGDQVSSQWESQNIAFMGNPREIKDMSSIASFGAETAKGAIQYGAMALAQKGLNKLGGLRTTLESAAGRRIAPNEAKVYTGTAGRSLNLSFIMSPKNTTEGHDMINMIDAFRQASMGQLEDIGAAVAGDFATGLSVTLKYPPLFDIKIISPNQPIVSGTFFEYKTMSLESFSVSYSDGNDIYTYFHDQIPTHAKLDLTFGSIYPTYRSGPITP